jgi:hypothetical protein
MKLKNLLLPVLILLLLTDGYSLPRFSLRGGSGDCLSCHVNPTGGNMRNRSGWSFGKNVLPMVSPGSDFQMSNKIGDNIQFGLDFRGQALVRMRDKTEFGIHRMTGSVYTNVDLSEKISAFARYDFIQDIWEAYGIAHILPNNSYIKAGTFQPNFGIRIDDHTAYTKGGDLGLVTNRRAGLIYDPRYNETGVEVGVYLNEIAFISASIGNPRSDIPFWPNSDLSWTANLKISPPINDDMALFVGGSFNSFRGPLPPSFNPNYPAVKTFGGYLGFGFKDFTVMGEFDIANDYLFKDTSSTALMIEAAYRIIKGLEFVVRLDRFDFNSKTDKDELTRIIIGFEIFPFSFIEIRPQYRIQMEEPKVDNNSAVLQFHLWY